MKIVYIYITSWIVSTTGKVCNIYIYILIFPTFPQTNLFQAMVLLWLLLVTLQAAPVSAPTYLWTLFIVKTLHLKVYMSSFHTLIFSSTLFIYMNNTVTYFRNSSVTQTNLTETVSMGSNNTDLEIKETEIGNDSG